MAKPQTPGLFHHFVRTTPRLRTTTKVKLGHATFKTWGTDAAGQLAEALGRRTVFARHSWERDLYSGKALLFRDRTAMEIIFPPGHTHTADAIREIADHHERLIFLTEACWRDRAYLRCGIFALGFTRCHCDTCGRDLLVAFACKGRGLCPSCAGRRMTYTLACASLRATTSGASGWPATAPVPRSRSTGSDACPEVASRTA